MKFNSIIVEFEQKHFARIYLNRPEKYNAFDENMINELRHALTYIKGLPDIRAVIIAGKGKMFCSGADLEWMQKMVHYDLEKNITDAKALAALLKELYQFPLPTLALVHGAAYGGALGLIAACDIAICEEKTTFALTETRIGLIPSVVGPYVVQAIGARAAHRYFLTAEKFTSKTAADLGLIHEVSNLPNLDLALISFKHAFLQNSPEAVKEAKSLLQAIVNKPIDDAMIEDTVQRIANIRVSEEGQEGLLAFLNKRPANWAKDLLAKEH